MQSGKVGTDVLLGKSQNNDRVRLACKCHPCQGFAAVLLGRSEDAEWYYTCGSTRLQKGQTVATWKAAWDFRESLLRVGYSKTQDCLPSGGDMLQFGAF